MRHLPSFSDHKENEHKWKQTRGGGMDLNGRDIIEILVESATSHKGTSRNDVSIGPKRKQLIYQSLPPPTINSHILKQTT